MLVFFVFGLYVLLVLRLGLCMILFFFEWVLDVFFAYAVCFWVATCMCLLLCFLGGFGEGCCCFFGVPHVLFCDLSLLFCCLLVLVVFHVVLVCIAFGAGCFFVFLFVATCK